MARKYKLSPGTWVEREMLESKAYLALRGFAPQLLILFLAKRQFIRQGKPGKEKRICINTDSICFTYLEAKKKYGISKPRFTRAIEDLMAKGFIKIVHQGGAYKQDKSIYSLSEQWCIWHEGVVFETRNRAIVKRGYCTPKKQK